MVGAWSSDVRPSTALAWLFLAVASVLALVFGLVPSVALADGESDEGIYSFYYTSGMAALYFEQGTTGMLESEDSEVPEDFRDLGVSFANAGGMLGFPDAQDDSLFGLGAFTSQLADGAQVYSYNGFPSAGGAFNKFRAFGVYGKLLNQLGLDETADVGGNALLIIVRFLMGALLLLPYAMASFVDLAFIFCVKLLQQLNPFALFSDIWDTAASSEAMESLRRGALGPLIAFVGGLYKGAMDFAWAVSVPALFLVTIVGYLLFNRTRRPGGATSHGQNVRRLVVKVAFIGLALPILGGAYTGFLDMVEDLLTNNTAKTTNANYVLYSTLVNFADWAEDSHLALPEGAVIVGGPRGGVSWGQTTPPRLLAQYVNGVADYTTDTYSPDVTETGQVSTWFSGVVEGFGFITDYMQNKDYNETDFETTWKGLALSDAGADDDFTKGLYEGLESTTKIDTYKDADPGLFMATELDDDNAKYVYLWDGNPAYLDAVSQTEALDHGGSHRTGLGTSGAFVFSGRCPSTTSAPTTASVRNPGSSNFGLSTMATYNYLRSSFGEDSFTCFSSAKVTTILSRVAHKSVCAVGDPMNRLVNILSAAFELTALAVVGWGYAFGLIFAVVTRGIKLITSLPGAMMGSMRHMVKLVLYVVAMAVEIVVTIALYALVSEFILVINDMFAFNVVGELFSAVGGAAGGAIAGTGQAAVGASIDWMRLVPASAVGVNYSSSGSGGPIVDLVMGLASCVVSLIFVIKAFTMRKKLIKTTTSAVDSAVTSLFGKATSAGGGAPSTVAGTASGGGVRQPGGGIVGTAARGVAAGLGYGAGAAVGSSVGGAIVEGAKGILGGREDSEESSGTTMEAQSGVGSAAESASSGSNFGGDGERSGATPLPSGEDLAATDAPLSATIASEGGAAIEGAPSDIFAEGGSDSSTSADVAGGEVSADGGSVATSADAQGSVSSQVDGASEADVAAEGGEGAAADVKGAKASLDATADGTSVAEGADASAEGAKGASTDVKGGRASLDVAQDASASAEGASKGASKGSAPSTHHGVATAASTGASTVSGTSFSEDGADGRHDPQAATADEGASPAPIGGLSASEDAAERGWRLHEGGSGTAHGTTSVSGGSPHAVGGASPSSVNPVSASVSVSHSGSFSIGGGQAPASGASSVAMGPSAAPKSGVAASSGTRTLSVAGSAASAAAKAGAASGARSAATTAASVAAPEVAVAAHVASKALEARQARSASGRDSSEPDRRRR